MPCSIQEDEQYAYEVLSKQANCGLRPDESHKLRSLFIAHEEQVEQLLGICGLNGLALLTATWQVMVIKAASGTSHVVGG